MSTASAICYLGGLFVSFMSGNSTRMGVSLAAGQLAAAEALGLIALFVLGAACGSLIVLGRGRYSPSRLLLIGSDCCLRCRRCSMPSASIASPSPPSCWRWDWRTRCSRSRAAAVSALTYVTGALVKVGQLIAAALTGGARFAWVPNLLLWAALVADRSLGALAYHWINLAAIWFAAAVRARVERIVAALDASRSH